MQLKKQDKPTLVELITASEYRDSHIVKHYGHLTMSTAMNAPSPSLGRLGKQYGDDNLVTYVSKMFIGVSLYFGEAMHHEFAEAVVRRMLAEYELRNLKLEDLVVICTEIVQTEQFGKFTTAKLLSHIRKYWKRRETAAVNQSLESVAKTKIYDMNMADRIHATLKKEGNDKTKQVDRTRDDVKKYYK